MVRIYPLSPDLVNQIAAGEVIERPASVVKELLENALDAKAHQIHLYIEAGGVQRIEMHDDGIGIHPDDLPLAVMSHATSKIRELNDLFFIKSLGFRGEALASIAAVSRFSMTSRVDALDEGYELTEESVILPRARTRGTTIVVNDLFYNMPVRRQFLSSEKTEGMQIEQMMKRVALSRFDVEFQLRHKTLLHWPAAHDDVAMEARIKKIFGSAFLAQSTYIDVEQNGLRLWGWVGLPSLMRSQNDLQYVYLNGRTIRDKLIGHAVRTAYDGHLYPGRQPLFLLYLEMSPEYVDVNVHPTKHEVRFREPRQVHDFVTSQLMRVLSASAVGVEARSETENVNRVAESVGVYEVSSSFLKNQELPNSQKILNVHEMSVGAGLVPARGWPQGPPLREPSMCKEYIKQAGNFHQENFSKAWSIQWLQYPYCLIKYNLPDNTQDKTTILCDFIQLYQGMCHHYFLQEQAQQAITSRPLLLPVRIVLPTVSMNDQLMKVLPRLEVLGLSLNPMDEKTWVIRAFPAVLPYLNFNHWIQNWMTCLEKKDDSDEALIQCLIQANEPTWVKTSENPFEGQPDVKQVWNDFCVYLMRQQNDCTMPESVKQSYCVVRVDDWKMLLMSLKGKV